MFWTPKLLNFVLIEQSDTDSPTPNKASGFTSTILNKMKKMYPRLVVFKAGSTIFG